MPAGRKVVIYDQHGTVLLWALVLAFGAAWLGQAFVYIPVADDFPLQLWAEEKGVLGAFADYFQKTGIRRSFQTFIWIPLYLTPAELVNALLVCLHLCATLILFHLLAQLGGSVVVAYAGALVFGVFPFTFGAVTWISGAYVMPNAIFFLGATLILVIHAKRGDASPAGDWTAALIAGVLVFLSCLTGEHAVFACALIGFLAAAVSREGANFAMLGRPYVFVPALSVCTYLALTLLTQSGSGLTGIKGEEISLMSTFNPESILSVWFYQWRHLCCLEPLLSMDAVRLTLREMAGWRLWTGVAALGGCIVLLGRASSPPSSSAPEGGAARWIPALVVIAMMLGVSFVHALAGGFSAQSRHQYVPLALVTMLAATLTRCMPKIGTILKWKNNALLAAVSALAVATTWLVTSINRYELRTYTALCQYIAATMPGSSVAVRYEPPIYHLWPSQAKMVPSHPYDAEWVLNESIVSGFGAEPVQLTETGGSRKVEVLRSVSPVEPIIVREGRSESR